MDNSPFGKLPGEIRNKIYEPVLYQKHGVHMQKHASSNELIYSRPATRASTKNSVQQGRNVLALAQTCRELRQECHALFFLLNIFHLKVDLWCGSGVWSQHHRYVYRAHLNACKSWLLDVGPENAKAIQRLVIKGMFLRLWNTRVDSKQQVWWKSAREIERQAFQSLLAPKVICTSFTYDFGGTLPIIRDRSSEKICKITGLTHSSDVGRISVTLPTSNKERAMGEIIKAFTKKHEMLRSHRRHTCLIDGSWKVLLEGLESSLEFMLDAVEGERVLVRRASEHMS